MKEELVAKIHNIPKEHPAYHGLIALFRYLDWLLPYEPDNWNKKSEGEKECHIKWRDKRIESTLYAIKKLAEAEE